MCCGIKNNMSRSIKHNPLKIRVGWVCADDNRPDWQKNRGKRHGNNRKMYSRMKKRTRHADRARGKQGLIREEANDPLISLPVFVAVFC